MAVNLLQIISFIIVFVLFIFITIFLDDLVSKIYKKITGKKISGWYGVLLFRAISEIVSKLISSFSRKI